MGDIPLNPNIQTNLKSLPDLVKNVVNQTIVTIPGLGGKFDPGNRIGVSGFVFDIVAKESIVLESDITDHWLEDNTAVQDHIALRPIRFTLTGYVGEIRDIFQGSFLSVLTTLQSFGTVAGLAPSFSAQAAQVYGKVASVASKVGNVYNQAKNVYDVFFGSNTTANRQQEAFQYFEKLWESRILCQVETPYGVLDNMAIESVQAMQDEDTRQISNFSVTFKKINKATTTKVLAKGRAQQIIKEAVNSGTTSGLALPGTFINQMHNSFVYETS